MDVKATLETKTSKSGNTYKCVIIHLTEDYEKVVFLDKAELALLEVTNDKTTNIQDFPFNH